MDNVHDSGALPGGASSPLRLHLGCGQKVVPGYLGVDSVHLPGVDVVWDLNMRPWPWSDDSVEAVLTEHTLEHLDDTVATMEEIWRVCKHDARVHIVVPYALSLGAFQDPTHRRFFTEQTFRYFTADSRWNFYTHARFEILKYDFGWFSGGLQDLRNIIPRPVRRLLRFFIFTMVDELVVDLRVVKR
jgi:SAM-dependent methyltransferase